MTTLNLMGTRIRQRRTELKMTQSALADALGLSQNSRTTILKWEKGTAYPDIGMIELLCKCLKCDAGYLFGEYDCKTRTAEDIHRETGLSEKAINTLRGCEGYSLGETAASLEARAGRPVDLSTVQARFLSRLIEDNNGKTLERIAYGALSIFNNSSFDLDTIEMYDIRDKVKSEKLSIIQDFLNFIDRCTNASAFAEEPTAPEAIR